MSWLRWADPFVDFGRELYVAWRLSEGASLYRDVAYFNGPLSPWWNAALFRVAGVSMRTLFAANLLVLAAVAALLERGLGRLFDRSSALLAVLFFLAVFAFGRMLEVASFNFVAPYSHEMTHGILIALVALAALARWLDRGGVTAALVAGGALGLLVLGKPEFALAVGGALVAGFAAAGWSGARPRRESARAAALAVAAAALPPVSAWLALRAAIGEPLATEGVLGAWRQLGNRELLALAFHREGLGTDAPGSNLVSACAWGAGIAAAVALGCLIAHVARRRRTRGIDLLFLLVPGLALWAARNQLVWASFARPLPFVLAAAVLVQTVTLARAEPATPGASRRVMRLTATVFALLLLLKMALNTRFWGYGFVLAAPGTLLAIGWLVAELPRHSSARRQGRPPQERHAEREVERPEARVGRRTRLWVVSLVLAVLAVHLVAGSRVWREQRVHYERGGDSFVGDAQVQFHRLLEECLRRRLEPGATLAVLPEGAMVNYLQRRPSSIPYVNFLPPELLMFGEERILSAFRDAPPDHVLLTNRDADEYGLRFLGVDHGRALLAWIDAGYEPVESIREPSSAGRRFSVGLLLRRRAAGSTPGPDHSAVPPPASR